MGSADTHTGHGASAAPPVAKGSRGSITTSPPPASAVSADESSQAASGEAIADRIAASISLGLLSVGDRLPTEIELAQQLGVAVATLRKGLSVLRDREFVVTRRGRAGGTFIIKAPFPTQDETRNRLELSSLAELRDLRDEHTAIGTAAARLAAQRAWSGSLGRLQGLAGQLIAATTAAEAASADSRFHVELAVLSQSLRLLRSEIRIQSESSPLLWSSLEWESHITRAHGDHLRIMDAVHDGDAARAADQMYDHLHDDSSHIIDAKLSIVHQ